VLAASATSLVQSNARQSQSQPGQGQPSARRSPQAKTQQEYSDYNAANAVTGGAAMEKVAGEFASKYPQSELRVYLYSKAMHEYQNENNPDKILEMGEKVLSLDPANSIALVLTATVLADSLSDADKDRGEKIAKIREKSNHALATLDSGFVPPPGATAEQIAAYKGTLGSMARSALGIMELKMGDDVAAEKDLQTAAALNTAEPDPYIWYHLALARDHLKKYADALAAVERALQYASSNPDLARLAQGERERLVKLAGRPQN
jgi:tetratricopeptide (TPR) repeat protein